MRQATGMLRKAQFSAQDCGDQCLLKDECTAFLFLPEDKKFPCILWTTSITKVSEDGTATAFTYIRSKYTDLPMCITAQAFLQNTLTSDAFSQVMYKSDSKHTQNSPIFPILDLDITLVLRKIQSRFLKEL